MKSSFSRVMPWVFQEEGGYVDHPKDPGGATNLGITIRTLSAWRGRPVTKQEVKSLTKGEAQKIYKSEYWDKVSGDSLPAGLDYAMFDYAINSGPSRANKELQRILKVAADGVLGKQSLLAISSIRTKDLIERLMAARLRYMKGLSTWKTFGKGWNRRVTNVLNRSLSLLGVSTPVVAEAILEAPTSESAQKARESDRSLLDIAKNPEVIAPIVGGISGFGSLLSGTGPIQWVLAVGLLVGIGYGLWRLIKKEQS